MGLFLDDRESTTRSLNRWEEARHSQFKRRTDSGEGALTRKSEREKRKVNRRVGKRRKETESARERETEASAINQLPSVEFFAAAFCAPPEQGPPAVVNHYDLYYYFLAGRKIIALQEASKRETLASLGSLANESFGKFRSERMSGWT